VFSWPYSKTLSPADVQRASFWASNFCEILRGISGSKGVTTRAK